MEEKDVKTGVWALLSNIKGMKRLTKHRHFLGGPYPYQTHVGHGHSLGHGSVFYRIDGRNSIYVRRIWSFCNQSGRYNKLPRNDYEGYEGLGGRATGWPREFAKTMMGRP
ncbi:hypothetical protein QJS10_CPA09g00800 [Acorus calamus]|uniref:Uncharacterized protein n=1 Tax=Acorus calamus TaxID=4465 RepID=A0AAV9E2G1_ACOCL|nr:hypothetical protein QJS10_CPA09g00800 [Acorus calamus]